MKIGIDIRTLMDARYSGVSEYTYSLIKEILKLDNNNEYRFFYNSFGDCPNIPEFKEKNVELVKYNYPNKVLNYLFFKFFNLPEIDKGLGVDIFFMPHINFIGLSGTAKRLITVHDLSFLKYPEFFSWRKNFWHRMVNVRKLVKRFDAVVAVSENTKRDLIELCGVDENRIKVIYAGVGEEYRKIFNFQFSIFNENFKSQFLNLNTDERKLLEIKQKYNLPDKFILYLGTVEPRKNVEGIIRAYNELRIMNYELREYKLVIAGGKGWKSKKIYQERESSEYKDDIKFLDYVDSEDKVYLYNLASVFIYPSFYEGFGLPPLEAFASGLPVVTSYASSLSEVAGDAALMVDPYNISDLARALKEILTDENLRNKLIERGLEQAKKFSWRKTADEYLEVLKNL
ncbi:MAG: glycosyltransferase family 1 protein [bacterium]|nr:glycosyltransferase family 1 protein [bacterium]